MKRASVCALLAIACSRPVTTIDVFDAGPPPPTPLEECLSVTSPDTGEPDWAAVETICSRGATKHAPEAIEWAGKARREAAAKQLLIFGERLHAQGKDDDAVRELSKIPPQSYTYARALPLLKQLVDTNLQRTKEECIDALAHPRPALLSCEQYFLARCFVLASSDVQPPPGKKLVLEGKLGANGWRPNDALLIDFLIAYQKQNPGGPAWECAGHSMAQRVCSLAPEAFRAQLGGDDGEALLAYCGQGPDAVEAWRYAKPKLFARIREVQRRLDAADAALRGGKLGSALQSFTGVLGLDAKLLHREDGKGARGWVVLTVGQTLSSSLKSCEANAEALHWADDDWLKQSLTRKRETLHCKP